MADSTADPKRRLVEDFNAVVEDTQKLLNALVASGAEKGSALRASAEQNLAAAREHLKQLQGDAIERGRAAAKATDEYVRENPWQSLGAVALVAALAGFVIGLMMNRR